MNDDLLTEPTAAEIAELIEATRPAPGIHLTARRLAFQHDHLKDRLSVLRQRCLELTSKRDELQADIDEAADMWREMQERME